jgi:hypothetical protein
LSQEEISVADSAAMDVPQDMSDLLENLPTTPNKRRTSPRKTATPMAAPQDMSDLLENLPPTTTPNKRRSSPRKTLTPAKPNIKDTIKSILADMAPPSEAEIQAKRTPKSAPLAEISAAKNSPAQLFPIFQKGFQSTSKSPADTGKKQAASKRKLHLATTVGEDAQSGLKQAVIDAGQVLTFCQTFWASEGSFL